MNELFSSVLSLNQLFFLMINMSLVGTFVILVICLTRLALKNVSKLFSYCLWAVVCFRLVSPYSIESPISLVPINPQTIPPDFVNDEIGIIESGIRVLDESINGLFQESLADHMIKIGPIETTPLHFLITIAITIWILGIIGILIYRIKDHFTFKQSIRSAVHIEDNVLELANIKAPIIVGLIKPMIYLPVGLSEKIRKDILIHEQIHISRYDYLVKFVVQFIVYFHWINPMVWVFRWLMEIDMEMSCDEQVLQVIGIDVRLNYSQFIQSLSLKHRVVHNGLFRFSEEFLDEGNTKNSYLNIRIKHIQQYRKLSRMMIAILSIFVVLLSIGLATNRTLV